MPSIRSYAESFNSGFLLLTAIVCSSIPISGALAGQPLSEPEPDYLVIGGGSSGVIRGERLGNGLLMYRLHQQWHGIHPSSILGVASRARYIALSAGYNYDLDDRFRLTLNIGPGLYERVKSAPNLGSPLEFLSTFELSWRIFGQQRVAVAFGHISNAHLASYNPGAELLEFSYQIPMR